jgi:hypothetical protein
MGARAQQLRSEIHKTRQDLAGHLAELKVESSRAARKAAMVAGATVALFLGYRILRAVLRRRGD